MATIEERIAVLDEFVLEDEQPNIEAPSDSIYYESYGFRNYADRGAFETAWGEETVIMAKMVRRPIESAFSLCPERNIEARRIFYQYGVHL